MFLFMNYQAEPIVYATIVEDHQNSNLYNSNIGSCIIAKQLPHSYQDASAPYENAITTIELCAREFLSKNFWPKGIQDCFIQSLDKITTRYFVCDDSGSMSSADGKIVIKGNQNSLNTDCR